MTLQIEIAKESVKETPNGDYTLTLRLRAWEETADPQTDVPVLDSRYYQRVRKSIPELSNSQIRKFVEDWLTAKMQADIDKYKSESATLSLPVLDTLVANISNRLVL